LSRRRNGGGGGGIGVPLFLFSFLLPRDVLCEKGSKVRWKGFCAVVQLHLFLHVQLLPPFADFFQLFFYPRQLFVLRAIF
jgi:hypothetical protein